MKDNAKRVLIAVLCVCLAGALIWAIAGQIAQSRYKLRLKSMYERSYYSFVGSMDELEVNLSKLMVTGAPEQEVLLLSRVSRLAEDTSREMASLSAGDESVSEMMDFVNRLGDYCAVLCQSAAEGQPISQTDRENLAAMLERQAELGEMVRRLDASVLTSLEMDEVEPGGQEDPFSLSVEPETQVPALIYDGPFSQAATGEPKALGQETITQEIANSVAAAFLGTERVKSVASMHGIEGEIPTFGVQVETLDAGTLFVQVTKQGGKVLLVMPESSPKESNYTVEQCRQSAEGFLRERGFGAMEAGYWQMYSGLVVFNFCAVLDGVRLYPDQVKVQVSMETGYVIGLEAGNYWRNHVERQLEEPVLTQAQAVDRVLGLEVTNVRLCVIPMLQKEKFCYEISGQRDNDRYLIYINALDGRVENILKLLLEEDKEMVV